ncbi:hypothetical protein TNCV_2006301 [Trichonephila clavipes]|nr:hypothetical protein TNCV_2006301 [Trichonephila clavipes]
MYCGSISYFRYRVRIPDSRGMIFYKKNLEMASENACVTETQAENEWQEPLNWKCIEEALVLRKTNDFRSG